MHVVDATIHVAARADGSVESSKVVQDPGDSFAAAAIRCARRTRFTPAKDAEGRLIRAVTFTSPRRRGTLHPRWPTSARSRLKSTAALSG
jgi:hypothetical protein